MSFSIRHARASELDALMPIYDSARAYMRANGNMNQWTGGYPQRSQLEADLNAGRLYVCTEAAGTQDAAADGSTDAGERIVAVFVWFTGVDPTYVHIYEGAWLNDEPYGVIHRIAVVDHRRGAASFCYGWALSNCPNLRIDTHRDNIPMQRSLEKNGFSRCGIIYLANGDERLAFHKHL